MRRTIFHPIQSPIQTPMRSADTVALPDVDTETQTEVAQAIEEIVEEKTDDGSGGNAGEGYRVILYNCDCHSAEEVAIQLHKATQYPPMQCWAIMLEADKKGRAICYRGSREKCHRVTRVLREIRLQCEVDCD